MVSIMIRKYDKNIETQERGFDYLLTTLKFY